MFKRNKGITLIALIITIIIMLILVAVSINLIINDKLFNSAGGAVSKTNEKVDQQQNRVDELMEKLEEVESSQYRHDWQYIDNRLAQLKCTCEVCKSKNVAGVTYSIGQQVKRTTSDTLLEEGETPTGAEWVVFGAEDCDKNGTNETLLITTLAPSTEKLTLSGADAYNNGIAKIEAKVKEIYGNEARAMKIEDVNRTLGYTQSGGMYYYGGCKTTGNFTTKLNELETWSTIQSYNESNYEGKFYTPEYPEGTADASKLGDYALDGYWYTVSTSVESLPGVPVVAEITSKVAKNLVFGTRYENTYDYWLASRGVFAYTNCAYFGPGSVDNGYAASELDCFGSDGCSFDYDFSVRAVVPLRAETPEGGIVLVSSDTWDNL